MKHLLRNCILVLVIVVTAAYLIYPPEKQLRLGKDLAGGVSLLYGVDVQAGDSSTIGKVIEVIKERLDPQGVLEISIVAQGSDRIEITMPLPTELVKAKKQEFEAALAKVAGKSITLEQFQQVAALSGDARTAEAAKLAGGDEQRMTSITEALGAFDAAKQARAEFAEAKATLDRLQKMIADAKAAGKTDDDSEVRDLTVGRDAAKGVFDTAVFKTAAAEQKFEDARAKALTGGLDPKELARALSLSNKPVSIRSQGKMNQLPSPRETAIKDLKSTHPEAVAKIDGAIAAWNSYESERRTLDDPQDIIRILKGAGVLNFRITVDPGAFMAEPEARKQLLASGPRSVRVDGVKWLKINKIQTWVDTAEELDAIQTAEGASGFFRSRGYVVERFKGEYYMLCWDQPGFRLTEDDGSWSVSRSFEQGDEFGRPAIGFEMDAAGAAKLGELTGANVQKRMGVVLDDEVYTAPQLRSKIARSGQITGNFNREELEYVIRVLNAGSLQAKLTPEPISTTILAPTLGADNLEKGLHTGVIAFVAVAAFMIIYYFFYGFVAVIGLTVHAVLLIGAMAANQAAFTLPGIAGVILTFGMAVDANVLIYERMREELSHGHDLRTAIRLGYDRAMAAIVDGNITTLIVCVVLGFTGTQEIKGFGLTLGIGTALTLFAQLFVTRLIFTIVVEKLHVRKLSMLTLVFPAIHRLFEPRIDWMKVRFVSYTVSILLAGMGVFFILTEGSRLLGLDFRGGTAVTIKLKATNTPAGGAPARSLMSRADVEARLDGLSALSGGSGMEVIAVDPSPDDLSKSDTFRIKTLVSDPVKVQDAVSKAFEGLIDSRPALKFEGSNAADARSAPVTPITDPILGDSVGEARLREPVGDFIGGAAIVLRKIDPPVSLAEIEERLRQFRAKPDYAEIEARNTRVLLLDGSPERATSAVIVVHDPKVSYLDNRQVWQDEVRDREWSLAKAALTQASTLSSVESFSPSVAASFRNAAIAAILLSTVMIVIYVWVRFSSFRYSAAAILTTLHDCLVAIGMVAIASVVYEKFPGVAGALGILPFKIDLNLVAAILTILGYSLNDTVIVMDRIRENRGKLPYASRKCVNDSINQTISRTIITSGTTFTATLILYIFGGEGVRAFAYTMLCGILVGTFSSIAVSAPLVWVRAADPHADETVPTGVPAKA